MEILFLTLAKITDIDERGIYQDLLRKFRNEGHAITIVTPIERQKGVPTNFQKKIGVSILQVRTLNIQKTNIIEKGIGTLVIEFQYLSAIKKYLVSEKFDLILYSTPPITLSKVIQYIKQRDNAASYLLLKDIFPQNAVDIGMIKRNSLLHSYFKKKERRLYELSDFIGCMSLANVDFLLKHHTIEPLKAEVCPNSIELSTNNFTNKAEVLKKYNIPNSATVFIYGGNLGKPQGIDFLLKVLKSNNDIHDRFFLVVGSGTELNKISKWFQDNIPTNAKLIAGLPKKEYDDLVQACDVGLIFLDPRFTIPNFPSRLLSYLEYKMPVVMAIDKNTDIGKIAAENGFGYWAENGNLQVFNSLLDKLCSSSELVKKMGERGYAFLKENYTVEKAYKIIMHHFI